MCAGKGSGVGKYTMQMLGHFASSSWDKTKDIISYGKNGGYIFSLPLVSVPDPFIHRLLSVSHVVYKNSSIKLEYICFGKDF